jgi:serine/threonine protein kinase
VYTHEEDDQMVYALKEMNKPIIVAKGALTIANNEVKILQQIPKSMFIVNIWYSFQDEQNAYVLMDYAPCGDLLFHMKNMKKRQMIVNEKGGTLTEQQGKFIVVCILEALRVIHEAGIVHRDIKPDNIIIDSNGYPKLADFGIAEFEEKIKPGSHFGTLSYMAPEIIFEHSYSFTADYYSLGVLLLLMVTGDMLSVGKTVKDAKKAISLRRDSITAKRFEKRYPELSRECCDFIVKLLATSQHQRIGVLNGVDDILQHDWLEDVDVKSIQDQSIESPIYDIATDKQAILELTAEDQGGQGEHTSYWNRKEKKAMKLISTNFVDYGNHWRTSFHAFDLMNVEFNENKTEPFENQSMMRRHTMSSISKQRPSSLSEIISNDALLNELGPSTEVARMNSVNKCKDAE